MKTEKSLKLINIILRKLSNNNIIQRDTLKRMT